MSDGAKTIQEMFDDGWRLLLLLDHKITEDKDGVTCELGGIFVKKTITVTYALSSTKEKEGE